MNLTAKTARAKRGKLVFLLIILTPLVIALAGGTMLYFWSKKKAQIPALVPEMKEGKPSPKR